MKKYIIHFFPLIMAIGIVGSIIWIFGFWPKPQPDVAVIQEEKRQEIIDYKLQKQECIRDNWDDYDRLWNEDCRAIRDEDGCALPSGLARIIEKKIGCEDL